jgi:anti-sigma B factor antagonist
MRLQIDSRVVGEVLVVKCSGRIVAGDETQALHDHVKNAVRETPDIVLQLGDVGFIDSSGLGTLVRLMTHTRSSGGDLKLCVIPEHILKTLRMTNLHTIFEAYGSEAEAITASYQRRRSKETATTHSSRKVVCFEKSSDVLAYLRELLRQAGCNVLTTSMWPDAQILIRATSPELIIVGPGMVRGDESAVQLLKKIAPSVPVLVLDEDFSTGDFGEAGVRVVEKVRQLIPAN